MFANKIPPCLYGVLVENVPGWLGELPSPLLVIRLVFAELVINKYVVEVQLLLNLFGGLTLLGESSKIIFASLISSFSNVMT